MEITRRDVLAGGLALAASGSVLNAAAEHGEVQQKRAAIRFAHLTDIHMNPDHRAPERFAAALAAAEKFAPAFLVTGGDHIGDGFSRAERAIVVREWDLYTTTLEQNTKLPVRPVMGNHDIWGWGVAGIDEQQAGFGKAMGLERLKLAKNYYSFDQGGWHFISLDNVARRGNGYVGALDPEQMEWLKGDLAANKSPVCLLTHIPLLAACVFRPKGHVRDDHWHVPDAWMHRDSMPLIMLLRQHNVKLCISGHAHMLDRVDFLGISFVCDGSICGRWWNGPYEEFAEGFGVFDLYADGTFAHQYHAYEWRG